MTTTQKTVGAGAMLLFLIAGLGHAGFFDRFTPEETVYIEGVELTADQVGKLISKAYDMKAEGKFDEITSAANPPERKIDKDDWGLFQEVLNDPSKLSQTKYIAALIRLLGVTKDREMQENLKELLCSAIPEICTSLDNIRYNLEATYKVYVHDIDIEHESYEALLDHFSGSWGTMTLKELLKQLKKMGDGDVLKGLEKVDDFEDFEGFKKSVEEIAPRLYPKYFK